MFGIFSAFRQFFSGAPPQIKVETQAEKQARHRQHALEFVKQQHDTLSVKQRQHEQWNRRFAKHQAAELSRLSGIEFEEFLAGLFRQQGYQVVLTPTTADFGADLLLTQVGQRIAVQAKCYTGSVGVAAVQEALSGMTYYQCQRAWVVTTGNYTPNAIELARKSDVRLLDSIELGKLIKQIEGKGTESYE
mgnify:CR=1 FL=1